MYKKIGIGIVSILIVIVLVLGGFLLWISIRDYVPEEIETLKIENNQNSILEVGSPFSVTTYNIGYAGLDKDTDFFMDGGTMSRARSKEAVVHNLDSITSYLKQTSPSILLIQELDIDSTRSYHINEFQYLQNNLSDYNSTSAYNYKVDWVPVPIFEPMGKARSVISTFSKYKMEQSTRYSLPGQESWPTQLFELDRCFIESRMPVDNGKELVLINLHLSAFDEGGKIRQQQIAFLKDHIIKEQNKGNYILVGGDWNHILPTTDPTLFKTTEDTPFWVQTLPEDFTPDGFTWVADRLTPSVRTLATTYTKDENYLAVIDGFLISNNIELKNVYGTNLDFEFSDHNPVTAEFILR